VVLPSVSVSPDAVLVDLPRARAGDPAAFDRLAALLPALRQATAPQASSLAERVQALLDRREALQAVARAIQQAEAAIPTQMEQADRLAQKLLRAAAPLRETLAAGQLVTLAQRLQYDALRLSEGLETSPDRFIADVRTFRELIDALATLVRDEEARALLQTLQAGLAPLEAVVPVLESHRDGLSQGRALAAQAADLAQQARATPPEAAGDPWTPAWLLSVGLLALSLVWVGLGLRLMLRDRRERTSLAEQRMREAQRLEEEQRRRSEEQQRLNEQNQQAILRLMNELQEVADGDLTVQATVTEDITGAIADSVNYTVEELRTLVARINSTAERVSVAAGLAEQTSARLLVAATGQSRDIQQTSKAVLSLAGEMNQVSAEAAESADVARASLAAAERGQQAVANSISGMNEIREQIQETSKRIKRLGESSQEIGEITELISDITEQTNVLALNAAIQAASAGEAGRGFTVVAEEVQRLAERSAEATKQIGALVRTIQTDTQDAVVAMEKSTQGVVEGARLSDAAGQALANIGRVSRQLAELIENISSTTARQSESANTVAEEMQRILAITQETSEGTQTTAQAIRELTELAQELKSSVARFRVS
jgi:twitching motility protein PilJ